MCGRFTLTVNREVLLKLVPFGPPELPYKPRYNIAPAQDVLTYGAQGGNTTEYMRCGLVPFWARDVKIEYKMINARSETVNTRNAFRVSLRKKRCLILADGFYEWDKKVGTRKPFRILLKSREPFSFADLWDEWVNKRGGYPFMHDYYFCGQRSYHLGS